MRILHILNDIRELGNGIVNVAIDLACLAAKAGHEVAVVSAGGEYEKLLSTYGVKHYQLNQDRKPLNILKATVGYQNIVKDFHPDIVHAHMMTGLVLARFLRGGFKYALVSTVHNEFQRSSILMGFAERVIAVSQSVAESMAQRGIPKSKLRVICNGTLGSPRNRTLSEYQPLALQHPAIVTVAGMYIRKGIAELISAFEQIALDFPQAHLYIVGDGPDKKSFEEQAKATVFGERIHFEGFQSEPQRYLLSSEIFVLASHKDPCPLVISEAREASCAIIGSEVDGIPEALDNGEAGILVSAKNSNALAKVLGELLRDSDALNLWKQKSSKNLDRLSANRVSQETLALYGELLDSYPVSRRVRSGAASA